MDGIRHLAPVIRPAAEPLERKHTPAKAEHYSKYRDCVRWEFGFTCPFCLVHERDLFPYGADRTALIWIEHRELRSDPKHPDAATDYENCYLSCRFCNGARQRRPVVTPDGRRLLDPCADPWAKHFVAKDDHLAPLPGDRDAVRTHDVFDLDDELKVQMRRSRREAIEEAVEVVRELPGLLRDLRAMAATANPPSVAIERAADELAKRVREALRQLMRWDPVPDDAPKECRCTVPHELPAFLRAQIVETEPPKEIG